MALGAPALGGPWTLRTPLQPAANTKRHLCRSHYPGWWWLQQ